MSYLNDEAFARSWALSRAETRGYGAKRIEQELKSKGISLAVTRQAIREAFEREGEKEKAKKLLAKRFGEGGLKDSKVLRRAIALLQRRGYSSEIIFELLGHLRGEE